MSNDETQNTAAEFNLKARECIEAGDLEGALEFFNRAMEALSDDQLESRAMLLNNRGHLQVGMGRHDQALESFGQAARIFQELDDPLNMAGQLGNVGSVHRDLEQYDAALESYTKALAVFEEQAHQMGIADQCGNIGYAHAQKREPGKAIDFFQRAKAIYDELGEERKAALCAQNIEALEPHV